jgi:hypothetical protein
MEASQKLAGGNPNLLPINLARQYSTVYQYTTVPMEAAVFLKAVVGKMTNFDL